MSRPTEPDWLSDMYDWNTNDQVTGKQIREALQEAFDEGYSEGYVQGSVEKHE